MRKNSIDSKVLELLAANGRITWADLGDAIGLSAPAAAERVRRLEEQGLIHGYTALLNGQGLGIALTAFIGVELERPKYRQAFLKMIEKAPEIQECHHVAGDIDYLLKVRCRDTAHLESILTDKIKTLAGVARTRTTVVLSTAKETARLPLPTDD